MVSQGEVSQLADHVGAQNETICLLREHLDEARKRVIELEKEKSKKSNHGHSNSANVFAQTRTMVEMQQHSTIGD